MICQSSVILPPPADQTKNQDGGELLYHTLCDFARFMWSEKRRGHRLGELRIRGGEDAVGRYGDALDLGCVAAQDMYKCACAGQREGGTRRNLVGPSPGS